ncbi:MAG: hypothetical protein KDB05_31070, partial [Planctomycetales bacterium]|nr:hypothetical protein [Planctomycetales bacterium]
EVIDRETIRIWAEFVQGLAETTEGDATLLDRTQVLLGSNLGNANAHTTNNLPILLAGGPYKHGSHLAFDAKNNEPLANLFVTMLRAMGLEADSFASSTGSLNGLEVAG